MNKKYENRPIDLLDLIWNIIFAWRRVLAWMVIFTLLLTGYAGLKYHAGMKEYAAAQKEYQDALDGKMVSEEKETTGNPELTKEEQTQVADAVSVQKLLNQTRDYMDQSILMNIDPYHENVLTMNFYVNTGYTFNYTRDNTKDYTNALVDAYVSYVNSGAVARILADQLKLDAKYIDELVSTADSGDTDADDTEADVFTVRLIYKDDSIFADASALIEKSVLGQQQTLAGSIGTHTVSLVSSEEAVQSDQNMMTKQTAVVDSLNLYRTQYTTLTANMSDQQKAELEKKMRESDVGQKEESIKENLIQPEKPSFSKKYPVLGAFLGIFLACVWIALKQIFSNRLQYTEELTEYFDLNQIGVLKYEKEQKMSRFDRWLRRQRYRNKKEIDADTRLGIVCANLELMCKREGITRVCLTGSEMEKIRKSQESVWSNLTERLSAAGIQVQMVDNICYDMMAMRTVSEVGAVVLVEQVNESIFQEIDKELSMLKQNEVKVVGAIGLEN